MVDQATRDAFSQLLIVRYLRWRGASVLVCNQGTLKAMCERHRPDVVFASWLVGGVIPAYLQSVQDRTRLVLVDQEGGRLGEEPFKRSFARLNGVKAELAKACARVITWGPAQAEWLRDLGLLSDEQIVVTGSPRFDPYLVPAVARETRRAYLAVTLRGDAVTSMPMSFMENVWGYAFADSRDGISVGYAVTAQHEDRIWHVTAGARHMFRIMAEVSRRTDAPIVVRPGPWERPRMYAFLPRVLPRVSIEPTTPQSHYVSNAFAVLDESSSLGLEALLAGVPVLTTQALIPRLREHIGGEGGALFNSPYTRFYWRPTSVEEAVGLVLRAERGDLAPTPEPAGLAAYLRDYHGWPRTRPSSFMIGDALLDILDVAAPPASPAGLPPPEGGRTNPLRTWIYRWIPGSPLAAEAKYLWQCVGSSDRELFRKYHYFDVLYPYHQDVEKTFSALVNAHGPGEDTTR
jgi:surface carbohydrate biosynthesis protein